MCLCLIWQRNIIFKRCDWVMISEAKRIAKKQLMEDEGYRQFPYKCTSGFLSIGHGHNLDINGISKQQALVLLDNDIDWASDEAQYIFPGFNKLSPARQAVLINMVFNMGSKNMSTFKRMIAAVEKQDHEAVCREMMDSKWAKQVGNRAIRLELAYRSG